MVVQHNITAINANRYYGINNNKLAKSLEKLSSGYAINRAGDNAAGLAVSEKMRSQIAGINQGVKNAQDGISMIQTFEGALTETDSILQRMKVLADQSANGTYQNEVDRDAIQLEFNQLNDELNQIADTDFNGVIVLNGGQMSDGLKQVDGKFDYSMKADQVAAANQEKLVALQADAQARIDAANKAVADAQKVLDKTPIDMSNNGAAKEWNTVDNNGYNQAEAESIFGKTDAAGTHTDGAIVDAKGNDLSTMGANSVDITFTFDGTDWVASKASAINGDGDTVSFTEDQLTKIKGPALANANAGKGGFVVEVDGTATSVNAIFDATGAKKGDTVTLTFTNSAAETYAPNNIGMDENSIVNEAGLTTKPTVTINADLTDAAMTEDVADALTKLNDATVSFGYETDGTVKASLLDKNGKEIDGFTIAAGANPGEWTISGAGVKLADITGAPLTRDLAALQASLGTLDNVITTDAAHAGTTSVYTFDGTAWKNADGDTFTPDNATTGDATNAIAPVKGDQITVTYGATAGTNGTVAITKVADVSDLSYSFDMAVDAFAFDKTGGYTVKAGKDKDINSEDAVAAQKALDKAKAELKAAQDAYPTELPQGVSKSDALDQASAPLTYTDHIMLQAGARTKDLVDFTFKYESQGLGDLKADLDCSARGLGTDKLSLATQEEANYAIDRIDNAINKTNMVRATFGAVQNRLEHKIDNLNVTSENLTSAESRIRDTNMAEEMMAFTKNQILAQASQSMLAQANQLPQGVLSLLQ